MYDSKLIMTTRCFKFVRITDENATSYEISLRPGAKFEYADSMAEINMTFNPKKTDTRRTMWRFDSYEEAEQKLQWAILKWD